MVALANQLEDILKSMRFRTTRIVEDGDITVSVFGKNGSAEIDFCADGEIIAVVDVDPICHSWHIFPNDQDFRASARKINDLIA